MDEDLVRNLQEKKGIKVLKLPLTRIAGKKMKNRMFTNIVMLGAITNLTGLISEEAMKDAVRSSVPKATVAKNLAALEEGFALTREIKG